MSAPTATSVLSAGGGLLGDIIGGESAQSAASTISSTAEAAEHGVLGATGDAQNYINTALGNANTNVNAAGANINAATTSANGTLQGYLNQTNSNLQPGINSGIQGNTSLQQYAASNPQFTAPTAAQAEATPGYQFQLKAGQDAIQNSAAASGLAQGGGTLAALTQYGQGLAGTYYQNAFNNAQSQFQTNQSTTLNNLQALIGSGNTANSQQIGATAALGAPQASNTINAATSNASLQQYLGSLNLQGQTTSGQEGMQGALEAGNFGLTGAEAHAAGILGEGSAETAAINPLTSLLQMIPGLGG